MFVYKGFGSELLKTIEEPPLINTTPPQKKNVLAFDKNYRKQLDIALLSLTDDDSVWITYEEYSLIYNRVTDAIKEDGLQLTIFRNNLYPDYYPIEFEISGTLAAEILETENGDTTRTSSDECRRFFSVYNHLVETEYGYFGSFYNYEYEKDDGIAATDYYPMNLLVEDSQEAGEYIVSLNEDVDTYLRDLAAIKELSPRIISLKSTNGDVAKRIQMSLQAYCLHYGIRLIWYHEQLPEDIEFDHELVDIAKNTLRIDNFKDFRKIRFYKNPDISKEVTELSQGQIIREIIQQAEASYDTSNGNGFRDVFITASTGAGKSVMFQIPAIYLAKHYHKLTIIIEPVIALMEDQKNKLKNAGFDRVESFNSQLITQVEKEAVLKRVKDGEVDLLYLSPETLLSYSIETIIGDREIGLIIVDEAHIVTTWGVGFRPDYWYLGGYLNRLRNQIQTSRGIKRKVYHFPICAFTATAINGGVDDSVSDTIISLYMENPIKYLGYVRRDDISFEIAHHAKGERLPNPEYEAEKCRALDTRIQNWLSNNEKTIVYFPYASLARSASKGLKEFAGITTDKRIGTYTGRNIDELSNEMFNEVKRRTFESFRQGVTPIMMATKAFGLGVDVNDVRNVYHYAVSGNLSDYVQEIGRAARDESLKGNAISDFFRNDMRYMETLFGMSQIKQYQLKQVLAGIYSAYMSKDENRSFLISPESFTYIFNGKDEAACINKLKICLLMLEKDFYDKYNFKVLISRPQSVFTKAFVCINRDHSDEVLQSKYGKYMKFERKGRYNELQPDGTRISDLGDIYKLDLEGIWEEFYPNISFPQFKYWYFNASSISKDKVEIMPSIRKYIAPRQKVTVRAREEYLLSELRERILQDFEYIADRIYGEYRNKYFTAEDLVRLIREKYGISKARIIANSLLDLVDPNGYCVKHRSNEQSGRSGYILSNGNFKEYMRKPIMKSSIVKNLSRAGDSDQFEGFVSLATDDNSIVALKLLSIFDYITYEVAGGEEPEIFIRLNDPNKVRNIVYGNLAYSNGYATRARKKHDRDVAILLRFFDNLKTDKERWDYIEDYFLGYDVLAGVDPIPPKAVKMGKSVDKEHSYPTNMFHDWDDLESFFDESESIVIEKLKSLELPIPEYLETAIKKSEEGKDILMSWPSKDTLICSQDISNGALEYFSRKGWHAYRIYEIDFDSIKGDLS